MSQFFQEYCPLCGAHCSEWGEGTLDPAAAVKEAQEMEKEAAFDEYYEKHGFRHERDGRKAEGA